MDGLIYGVDVLFFIQLINWNDIGRETHTTHSTCSIIVERRTTGQEESYAPAQD